ncbi:PQQ-binding-like beta-propeller repeat protein [Hahella sp. HN01]|nr:PQQ-binding-like beta-propeller repeat protein [Hahella sp. HN01]
MKPKTAQIIDEYGPFPDVDAVHGVSYDGRRIWFASGDRLNALDPTSGERVKALDVIANAGTAFDGKHLYQITDDSICKIDPDNGHRLATIPAPDGGCCSGLAWAEGRLWVGQYKNRRIHQLDPDTGEILSTIESNRFVTGVTWLDGELWHGTWEGEESELRRVDHHNGNVLESISMPPDIGVSGLESNGRDRFYCGGGNSGKVRVVLKAK